MWFCLYMSIAFLFIKALTLLINNLIYLLLLLYKASVPFICKWFLYRQNLFFSSWMCVTLALYSWVLLISTWRSLQDRVAPHADVCWRVMTPRTLDRTTPSLRYRTAQTFFQGLLSYALYIAFFIPFWVLNLWLLLVVLLVTISLAHC